MQDPDALLDNIIEETCESLDSLGIVVESTHTMKSNFNPAVLASMKHDDKKPTEGRADRQKRRSRTNKHMS